MLNNDLIARGALAGWRRKITENGCILKMQIAQSAEAFKNRAFDSVEIALNDRQLRSLARDLQRVADERGVELWAKRPLWKQWLQPGNRKD
jgi:hypothetical protein